MAEKIVISIVGNLLGSSAKQAITAFWKYIHPYGCKDIKLLEGKLLFISVGLQYLSGSEQTDPLQKKWMHDARELLYDIEDVTGNFGDDDKTNKKIFKTIADTIKAFVGYFQYSEHIGEAMDAVAAAEKEFRTKNEHASGDDRRRHPLNIQNSMGLVGMKDPTEKIIRLLSLGDILDLENSIGHKVLAIRGVAGLGTTTLAAHVYNEIKWRFDCTARVFVTRFCKSREVLIMLLQEFGVYNCKDLPEATLVSRIQEYVSDKRFLVILDDVWDKDLLKDVENSLLGGYRGGRIIMTTRRNDVAQNWSTKLSSKGKWGGDLCIKPLNDVHSKQLLPEKVSLLEKLETSKEYVDKLLVKCSGSPLALTAVYDVVSGWKGHKIPWDEVYRSISEINAPSEIQRMREDLSHSYWDLPYEYRDCFLYLSLFPHDQINKKRLVSRWVAEGLIAEDKGKEAFEELVNRNLILKPRIKYDGDESIYQVHPTIHDFVVWKSVDYNFITLPGAIDQTEWKIRRISVHRNTDGRENIKLANKELCHLRSLSMCEGLLPPKELSSVLRVLDLEDCTNGGTVMVPSTEKMTGDIKPKELFHRNLRYLKLKEGLKGYDCHKYAEDYMQMTGVMDGFLSPEGLKKLMHPKCTMDVERIGCARNLQTLDLRGFRNITLDEAVTDLKFLARLLVDPETRLPNGIRKMKALEELQLINVWSYDLFFVKDLRELSKLKAIGICLCANNYCEKKEKELFTSLTYLAYSSCLKSVCIDGVGIIDCIPKEHLWGALIQVCKKFRMTMGCQFRKVPSIGQYSDLSLNLERLRLGVTGMPDSKIGDLGKHAFSLSHLFLDLSEDVPEQTNMDIYNSEPIITKYNFANRGFQYLMCLGIRSSHSNIELRFSMGAPQHLKLQLAADEDKIKTFLPKNDKMEIEGLPDDFYYDTNPITSLNNAPLSQQNNSNKQGTTWTAVHIITPPRPRDRKEGKEVVVTIKIENQSATLSIEVQESHKRVGSPLPDVGHKHIRHE